MRAHACSRVTGPDRPSRPHVDACAAAMRTTPGGTPASTTAVSTASPWPCFTLTCAAVRRRRARRACERCIRALGGARVRGVLQRPASGARADRRSRSARRRRARPARRRCAGLAIATPRARCRSLRGDVAPCRRARDAAHVRRGLGSRSRRASASSPARAAPSSPDASRRAASRRRGSPAARPSQLTKLPAVSVNGEIGSSTSAYVDGRARTGVITTTRSACCKRVARGDGLREVELGLGVQHEIRLARLGEHRLRVHAARLRQRAGEVRADGVGGLGQEAERRAGDLGERPARARGAARPPDAARRSCRGRSRPSCPTRGSRRSPSRRRWARCPPAPSGTALPAAAAAATAMPASAARQLRRRDDRLVRDAHQPVVVDRMQHRDLRALLRAAWRRRCATQRMVLAQEAADDQHAIELVERRRPACRATACPARWPSPRKSALAQAEVDVVAAEAAHEACRRAQLLERGMRRHERADRARRRAARRCRSGRARRSRARSASRPPSTRRPA